MIHAETIRVTTMNSQVLLSNFISRLIALFFAKIQTDLPLWMFVQWSLKRSNSGFKILIPIECLWAITEKWAKCFESWGPYAMYGVIVYLWWQYTNMIVSIAHPCYAYRDWPWLRKYQNIEVVIWTSPKLIFSVMYGIVAFLSALGSCSHHKKYR